MNGYEKSHVNGHQVELYLLPMLSGLLCALALPNLAWGWLAWFALVPLFCVMHTNPWRAGFCAGAVYFATVLYWLNNVMTVYGQLPMVLSIVVYLLLVAYLAIFWGAICWCSCRIVQRLDLPSIIVIPIIWLVFEYGRNFLLTGFPWANIAYSQMPYPVLLQSADLAGVYLLVFLLVLVNCVVAQLWQAWRNKSLVPWRLLLVVVALWLTNYGYGLWRLNNINIATGERLHVRLVQGNVEQSLKWQPQQLTTTLTKYKKLSVIGSVGDAINADDTLVVWPESATPFFFQDGGNRARLVQSVAQENNVLLLFGSPAYALSQKSTVKRRQYSYLNSAYLLSPQGSVVGRSDKVHLVPFGEYVPLSGLLSFVEKLAQGVGDFIAGDKKLLPVGDNLLGVLVCYEAIFPEIARQQVAAGAGLLVNITNDAWFGESAAPWQHLAMTRMRAIENRVWIARCANTGVSAFIDPTGRVISPSQLFTTETVSGDVYFCNDTSLYTHTGDTVPLLLCGVVLVWLWQSRKGAGSCC